MRCATEARPSPAAPLPTPGVGDAVGDLAGDAAAVVAHGHAQPPEAHLGAHDDAQRAVALAVLDRVLDERLHEERRHRHRARGRRHAQLDLERVAEARPLERQVRLDVDELLRQVDERRRAAQRPAAVLGERQHEVARLLGLRAAEGRDRVQRVEQEVRLDLRLQRGQLGVRRGARGEIELADRDLGRHQLAEVGRDRAIAIRDRERALGEQHERADRLAAHEDRRDDGRLERAVATVAAVAPADRQARDATLGHRGDGAGRRGTVGAVVVGAEPDVREHAAPVGHGDGAVAEPCLRLEREDPGALRIETRAQQGPRGLEHLEDLRGGRLAERHHLAERGAHQPHPGDERERRERDDRHEPEQRRARLLQRQPGDRDEHGLRETERRRGEQRAAHLGPAPADPRGGQSPARRGPDEALRAALRHHGA